MKKILVIEDETITRNLFLDLLAAEGYHTIAAQNGLIGVQKAQEHLPDLVLCDIIMPLLDGYGVLKALRQNPNLAIVPFIFLSARVNKADIREGMELGADDYLTKPCTVKYPAPTLRVWHGRTVSTADASLCKHSLVLLSLRWFCFTQRWHLQP